MVSDGGDHESVLQHCRDVLKAAGVRATHQRLEVFREVVNSSAHPDAETVFEGVRGRVPTISLDTVYRTLWLLTDLGLITTLGLPQGRFRFDGNMRPHHHFICMKCGMAADFYSRGFDRLRIPDAVKELGAVERTQVEVRGVCRRCLQEDDAARGKGARQARGCGRSGA